MNATSSALSALPSEAVTVANVGTELLTVSDVAVSHGDYSVDLFRHIDNLEDGCFRSLFDMAAVAIVKDPSWAEAIEVPSPIYLNDTWVEQPGNSRKITVWENFNSEAIMADFYKTLEESQGAME